MHVLIRTERLLERLGPGPALTRVGCRLTGGVAAQSVRLVRRHAMLVKEMGSAALQRGVRAMLLQVACCGECGEHPQLARLGIEMHAERSELIKQLAGSRNMLSTLLWRG